MAYLLPGDKVIPEPVLTKFADGYRRRPAWMG